jgi:hypothetical protein
MALNNLSYQLRVGNQLVASQTVPISDAGLNAVATQNLGTHLPVHIDPSSITMPAMTAREAQIAVHGEQLEVYQLTVSEGGSPVIDVYVTQLGQVISAKTSFGYSLEAEE